MNLFIHSAYCYWRIQTRYLQVQRAVGHLTFSLDCYSETDRGVSGDWPNSTMIIILQLYTPYPLVWRMIDWCLMSYRQYFSIALSSIFCTFVRPFAVRDFRNNGRTDIDYTGNVHRKHPNPSICSCVLRLPDLYSVESLLIHTVHWERWFSPSRLC